MREMTTYTVRVAGVEYPCYYLSLEKYLDTRPSLIVTQIPYHDIAFGNYVPLNVYRDGQLYLAGSVFRPDHALESVYDNAKDMMVPGPPTTTLLGLCHKARLLRRFEKPAGTPTVTYAAATETAIFTDIIDSSAGLTEGRVTATVYTLSHTFKGESCAHALEMLSFLTTREFYVRNDLTVDFRTSGSIGKSTGIILKWGENATYARRTGGDGFRVFNNILVYYNAGASTSASSDASSVSQYGQRDITTDLYSVTEAASVNRYRDNVLTSFKQPVKHGCVGFKDTTTGFTYDCGDYVTVDIPDIGYKTEQRIFGIRKQWTIEGEITALDLAKDVKAYDTRRYRPNDLSDAISSIRGQIHGLGVY